MRPRWPRTSSAPSPDRSRRCDPTARPPWNGWCAFAWPRTRTSAGSRPTTSSCSSRPRPRRAPDGGAPRRGRGCEPSFPGRLRRWRPPWPWRRFSALPHAWETARARPLLGAAPRRTHLRGVDRGHHLQPLPRRRHPRLRRHRDRRKGSSTFATCRPSKPSPSKAPRERSRPSGRPTGSRSGSSPTASSSASTSAPDRRCRSATCGRERASPGPGERTARSSSRRSKERPYSGCPRRRRAGARARTTTRGRHPTRELALVPSRRTAVPLPDAARRPKLPHHVGRARDSPAGSCAVPDSFAQYVAPGYIVFAKEGTLLAQRFDPEAGQVSGEAFAIAGAVQSFATIGWAAFAASPNGVLAFASPGDRARLSWFDRSGHAEPLETTASMLAVRFSPDGRRALFNRPDPRNGNLDIWALDVARGTESRVTSDPDTETGGPAPARRHPAVLGASGGLAADLPPRPRNRREPRGHRRGSLPARTGRDARRADPGVRRTCRLRLMGPLLHPAFGWSGDAAPGPPPSTRPTCAFLRTDASRRSCRPSRAERDLRRPVPQALREDPGLPGRGSARAPMEPRRTRALLPHRRPQVWPLPVGTEARSGSARHDPCSRCRASTRWASYDIAPDGRFLAIVPERPHLRAAAHGGGGALGQAPGSARR